MKEPINILCIADDNYAPYCGVMLTSVFENNRARTFLVYIFVGGPLKKRNALRLIRLGKKYGNSVRFIVVEDSFLRQFSLIGPGQWMSLSTFYRLYAAALLPVSVKRVLYLDDDIIVTGDLSELWETDLSDKAVAAVADMYSFFEVRQSCLNYPVEAGYFNGGMLLLNLDYWRENGIGELCFRFLEQHHDILKYYDQDILNAVLWDKKTLLPIRNNYQVGFLYEYTFKGKPPEFKEEILSAVDSPLIIHYSAGMKPWMMVNYKCPFKSKWLFYKRRSPWPFLPEKLPPKKRFNWMIKRYFLWPIGLMKYSSGFIRDID